MPFDIDGDGLFEHPVAYAFGEPDNLEYAIASTVGVIGSIQVNEALKLLSRVSKPVLNKLIVYDGYRLSIEKIDVKKNPDCPVCSRI